MQLLMKQRVFSWGNTFDIYDTNQKPVYLCKSQVFSIKRKLRVFDMDNNELVYIEQQIWKFMPHYDIYINGEKVCTMIQKFSFAYHRFYFQDIDWIVQGDFWAHNYCVQSKDETVLTVSKKWFSWGDTYIIDINSQHDPVLALAVAIVLDCVCHDNKN